MSRQSATFIDRIELPPPRTAGGMPLRDALYRRRSCREFAPRPLTPQQTAQLCWSAQGITHEEGFRTAPSAGAIYPLTLFLATADGLYEYLPEWHALRFRREADVRAQLQTAALDQEYVGETPLCLIVVMNVRHQARKYGRRAEQYCLLEAGHVAQNVLLEATAMNLGSVPVGAFQDAEVSAILKLPAALQPVYLLPVGHPR